MRRRPFPGGPPRRSLLPRRGILPVLFLLIPILGCSRGIPTHPRGGGSGLQTVAPGSTARVVAGPRPVIEITSPRPAAWVTGPGVNLEGRAEDPSGVAIRGVQVNQQPATLRADGSFSAPLQFVPGINTVSIRAENTNGVRTYAHVSYLCGPFRPLNQPGLDALSIRLNPQVIPPLEAAMMDVVRGLNLNPTLQSLNPVFKASYFIGLIKPVANLLSISYRQPTVSLDFVQGGISATIAVHNLRIDLEVKNQPGFTIPFRSQGAVTADTFAITVTIGLAVGQSGAVSVSASPSGLRLDNYKLALYSLPGLVVNMVKDTVRQRIVDKIDTMVRTRVPALVQPQLAGFTNPKTVKVRGVDLAWSVRPSAITIDPSGISFVTGLGLDAPPAQGMPSIPGYPASPSAPLPALGTQKGFYASFDDDTVNRALVVAWRAGLMNLDLDQATAAGMGLALPTLDFGTFERLMPELKGSFDPKTPMVIRLRPKLPPHCLPQAGGGIVPFVLRLGECHVELLADRGAGALQSLVGLTVHTEVPVDLSMRNGVLSVASMPKQPSFLFHITDEPLVRFDHTRVQTLLSVVLDAMLPKALSVTQQIQVPSFFGLSAKDLDLSIGGPGGDVLTLDGNLIKR